MKLQESIRRILIEEVSNKLRFFRRRIDLNDVKELIPINAEQIYYETNSYEQFKYELTLRAVEGIMWNDYGLGYEDLPEQEEIEFVNNISDAIEKDIKKLYKGFKRKVLKEQLEYLDLVIKDYEDGFDVFIMDKDNKIGEISFVKESRPNQYTIVDATIDDEYKGQRIYPKTIVNIFKHKPNIIINSVFRSNEAEKSWRYILDELPSNIEQNIEHYEEEGTTLYQLRLKRGRG